MADDRLEIRMAPAFKRRLEELAVKRSASLSQTVKAAVMEASLPEGDVPSEEEVLEMLGQAARNGNVAAMKELRNYHRERNQDSAGASFSEFDELAQRRAVGA